MLGCPNNFATASSDITFERDFGGVEFSTLQAARPVLNSGPTRNPAVAAIEIPVALRCRHSGRDGRPLGLAPWQTPGFDRRLWVARRRTFRHRRSGPRAPASGTRRPAALRHNSRLLLYYRLPRKVVLGRAESAEWSAISRTTLRRAFPSFTVEVRRRPRLATTSGPNVQTSETKPPPSAFDRESYRAAAAAFDAKKVDQSPVDVAASSPKGRILQSLVADEPPSRPRREPSLSAAESDPTSRTPKRRSMRPLKGRKGRDQASKPPQNSGTSSAESTPFADRLSAGSRQPSSARPDEGTGVSPSDPTTAPSQVVGNSRALALRAKAKRRDKMPIFLDAGGATPLP